MSDERKSRPSFSTASRWRIGFDVVLRTVLVLAVAVMANYLGARFFHRFQLSLQKQTALSSRTLSVLQSVTNHVDVTLYYDREANFYQDVLDLLIEYQSANKNISVQTVDYNRDPGRAKAVQTKYGKFFSNQSDKDLVIFDCGGRVRAFPGDQLTQYKTVQVQSTDPKVKFEFERRPVAFNGELAFTSILLSLANPQPLKAYFLQGHGEVSLSGTGQRGYQTFASVVEENYISITNLYGVPNTGVPADCNLLVIAAPSASFDASELERMGQYLREGGSLLAMFSYDPRVSKTGLDEILRTWGVDVKDDVVQDFNFSTSGFDIKVHRFNAHPVVDAVSQVSMRVYQPYAVLARPTGQAANAPKVTELFESSPGSTLMINSGEPPHAYPLACAVEQTPVAGVTTPRGNTRMIVVGDAAFLGNQMIDLDGNRDFLNAALNWLCDRPPLVAGIGPRPVTNLRVQMTHHEQRELGWLLLAALPGVVLALGWLVWLVRRK